MPWLTPDSFPGAGSSFPAHRGDSSRCSPAQALQTPGAVVLLQVAQSLGVAFFSSRGSKCFICSILLNHRHICTEDTRNSLLGFPHQLPALNIKYSGLYIHACHLHGCLDSSHQWEQGRLPFICFLYRIAKQFQRCSLQGKKYLQNTINNQQNRAVLGSRGNPALPTAVGTHQTRLSPPPRCSQGSFPTFTRHRWRLQQANIFLTGLWEDTQLEKMPKQAPGMAKGGGRGKKPPAAGLRPKHARTDGKAGSLHCCEDNARVLRPQCCFPLHLQLEIALVFPVSPRVLSLQVPSPLPLLWLDLSPPVTVANVRIIPSDKVSARPCLPCLLASLSRPFPHV